MVPRAVAAARHAAAAMGLAADEVTTLSVSNTVVLHLLPADVIARVGTADREIAAFEVRLGHRLLAARCPVVAPVGTLAPLVDGFEISFWQHHDQLPGPVDPSALGAALGRLHVGMAAVEVAGVEMVVSPVGERIGSALDLLTDPGRTPELGRDDRLLLTGLVTDIGAQVAASDRSQLLHGEPHPGNVLATREGPLFIDLETCCRGPVEFDLAHLSTTVAEHYPGPVDQGLLRRCRRLTLAMAASWRFDRDDRFPDGLQVGRDWVDQLRSGS